MGNLGIYVQIPFCASKCSYCNFSSQVARADVFDSYCRAVEQEIEQLPRLQESRGVGQQLLDFSVDTLYVGGGTPPIVGQEQLARILNALRGRFRFTPSPEFTLEVTPGSADAGFLAWARRQGVNRLSIGAQSFNDTELRSVGRLHSAAAACELTQQARQAGITNLSLDLIAGLPHQTEASWEESRRVAATIRPEHISVYLFEVDEKSHLGREVLRHGTRYHAEAVPDEDFITQAYEVARGFLRGQGYIQYEISNFALPGYESRHNQKYWRLEPYIGLGAGAHSFDGERRWANETAPEVYVHRLARGDSPIAEVCRLSPQEQLEEFFFVGLRQTEGIDLAIASRRWGAGRIAHWEPTISVLAQKGWLERRGNTIRLSEPAYLISNEVFQEFVTV
jgi:oxygen-independent coproporphyrinogen-3 oxidase